MKTQWALFRYNRIDTEVYGSKVPANHDMIIPPPLRQPPPYNGAEARFARLEKAHNLYSLCSTGNSRKNLLNHAFLDHERLSSNTIFFYTPGRTAHTTPDSTSVGRGSLQELMWPLVFWACATLTSIVIRRLIAFTQQQSARSCVPFLHFPYRIHATE